MWLSVLSFCCYERSILSYFPSGCIHAHQGVAMAKITHKLYRTFAVGSFPATRFAPVVFSGAFFSPEVEILGRGRSKR